MTLPYSPTELAAFLPLLLFVACPLLMWFMMRSMGSMSSNDRAASKDAIEVVALRNEVERLRGQNLRESPQDAQ